MTGTDQTELDTTEAIPCQEELKALFRSTPFMPHHEIVVPATASSGAEAARWIRSIHTGKPVAESRSFYRLAKWPEAPASSKSELRVKHGPLVPTAVCPETGRRLHLHLFRDASFALLREPEEASAHACEVLPILGALNTETPDARMKEVPVDMRSSIVPRLRLQVREDGIRWGVFRNENLSEEILSDRVLEMLTGGMLNLARLALAAKPVADPRYHEEPPEGARFWAHGPWPKIDPDHPGIRRLESIIRVLVQQRMDSSDNDTFSISIYRQYPDQDWGRREQKHKCSLRVQSGYLQVRDRPLKKTLNQLVDWPDLGIPSCFMQGGSSECLLFLNIGRNQDLSAHQRMASLRDLAKVAPGFVPEWYANSSS